MIKPLFQNIIVGINGSQSAVRAAQYGILMAKLYECAVKAVYVVDTATLKQLTISKYFVRDEFAKYEKNLTEDGMRYLDYVAKLGKQKKVNVETEIRRGAVWTELITVAGEFQANLILLGGYSDDRAGGVQPQRAAGLSTSEIIANAPCSVLVVREQMLDQLFRMA